MASHLLWSVSVGSSKRCGICPAGYPIRFRYFNSLLLNTYCVEDIVLRLLGEAATESATGGGFIHGWEGRRVQAWVEGGGQRLQTLGGGNPAFIQQAWHAFSSS